MNQKGYENISIPAGLDDAVKKGIEEGRRMKKRQRRRKLAGFGGAAAAVALTAGVLYSNPALAAKLPLIGHIFQEVEQSIPYPGNYSDKAAVLEEPESLGTEALETGKEGSGTEHTGTSLYSAADKGITLTASEVYWSASKVNITFSLEYDKLGEMPSYQQGYEGTNSNDAVQMMGRILVNGKEVAGEIDLYGRQTDGRTFVGAGQVNLEEIQPQEGDSLELELTLDQLWWNDASYAYREEEGASQYSSARVCQGTWKLSLPVSETAKMDTDIQKLELNETNQEGFGFGTLTATDYEISVEMLLPELDERGREAFFDQVQRQAVEALGEEGAAEFYRDALFEPGQELQCGVAAFDQNGERLSSAGDSSFETGGNPVRQVRLYLLADDITAVKVKDEKQAEACAVYAATVNLKEP